MTANDLRKLIREEIKKIVSSAKTGKTSLKEGFSWERKPGKPLPTIAEVQAEYQKKKKLKESRESQLDVASVVLAIRSKQNPGVDVLNDFMDWLIWNPAAEDTVYDLAHGEDAVKAFEKWSSMEESVNEASEDSWGSDDDYGSKDLDSSKGGTDNSMNKVHSGLVKVQKQMEKLLADFKAGKMSKDNYISKRKPLQAQRDKLEKSL
jgi:hypothetical protein